MQLRKGNPVEIGGTKYEVVAVRDERIVLDEDNTYEKLDEALADCFSQNNYENLRRSSSGTFRVDITRGENPKLPSGYTRTIYEKTGMIPISQIALIDEGKLRVWFEEFDG